MENLLFNIEVNPFTRKVVINVRDNFLNTIIVYYEELHTYTKIEFSGKHYWLYYKYDGEFSVEVYGCSNVVSLDRNKQQNVKLSIKTSN